MRVKKSSGLRALACASALALACEVAERPPSGAYLADLDAWKTGRDEELRRDDGWLSLVGLFWLEDGHNTLGSSATSDVIFPSHAAEELGFIVVTRGEVRLEAFPASGVTHEGEAVSTIALVTDLADEPTLLQLGSLTFYVIDRGGRLGVRMKDSAAPALQQFQGMNYFPVSATWRVTAEFVAHPEPQTLSVPNVIGTSFEEPVPGILRFEVEGESFELTPVGEPGEDLFIVFGDETNGSETYGGGRFLIASAPGPDGTVELDFNTAHNPPCVFTPYATCPLPAPENRLAVPVRAGELAFGPGH